MGALGAFVVAETICNGFHDRVVFTYHFAVSSKTFGYSRDVCSQDEIS